MGTKEPVALPGRFRRLTGSWRVISVVLPLCAVALGITYTFNITLFGHILMDTAYLYLLLAAFLPLVFIWMPPGGKTRRPGLPWYDTLLAAASFVIPLYFFYHETEIMLEGWQVGAPPSAIVIGSIIWLISIEAGRRAAGLAFALSIAFFAFYPLFSSHMPMMFRGPPFLTFRTLTEYHIFSQESMFGVPLHMFGEVIFGYLIFAVVLQSLGVGKFFTDLAKTLLGNTRAFNAKVAILAGYLFGAVSASGVSTIFVTGAFTIPAMKKEGLPAEFAAAVEACSGEAGALTPPVMGAATFIMAEFIGVPYTEVCIAAAIPSLAYYICLFSQIDSYAARIGLKAAPTMIEVPPLWKTLTKNWYLLISFAVLIFVMFYLRLPNRAPWYATAAGFAGALAIRETRSNFFRFFFGLFENVGRSLCTMIGILTPCGLLIGAFIVTGVAFTLPYVIVDMARQNMILMLMFGAVAAFILGTGLPLTAVYVFLAIVLAPGLVKAGIDVMAAHLFCIYWGIISGTTPPVAIHSFAAATLADADPMKTAWKSCQLGIAKYILPFVFVLSPALIIRGPVIEMLYVIPFTLLGLTVLSAAIEGYFWRLGILTVWSRVLLFGIGILMEVPDLTFELYAAVALVAIFALYFLLRMAKSPLLKLLVKPEIEKVGIVAK